ncbi:MAG: Chromosome partition protein Smc [Chlamydiales bacterium]|nr:Chromosome partition protein Smc [Chlamydiales bacterium]
MKLKKLTILGFKSFADKISIDFDCEIVGVVGPNGCGKSNIVDAFRWVMGEQSAKSLRGDKMYDVLFAGTDSRKPLNLAEVSVTLSDIKGELPIAYDEVTITRRLYRNGDSEYLINKQPVRLKDIQNLFLGSGIGKNTFSIFEQGKLDQVIHLNPTDRRAIFDEAAGIGRFIQRKKETLRKLDQVNENYHRLSDVHHEVEKQTKLLKKQAAQAQNYQHNKERLEELEKGLLVTRWRTLTEKNRELEQTLLHVSEEIKEEHHRLVAVEEHLEKTKKALKEKDEQAKAEALRFHQAETQVQVNQAELKQQKERMVDFQQKMIRLKEEHTSTATKRESLLEEIEKKKALLAEAESSKASLEEVLSKEKEHYQKCEHEMGVLRKELKTARESHLQSIQEEAKHQNTLQEKRLALHANQQRIESLTSRIEEKREEKKQLKGECGPKQKEVKALASGIDQLKVTYEAYRKDLGEIQKELEELQLCLESSTKDLTELTAREQALLRLKEDCEGFSSGAKKILQEPLFKGKVHGLFEVLDADEKMMPALQMYAQTLAVSTQKDLKLLLDYAEKEKLTDFSVVLLVQKTFLKGVRLVEDLKTALKVKEEVVTRSGYYLDSKGVIFRVNATHKEGNPFLREAELATLFEQKARVKNELSALQKKNETLLKRQKESEEARDRVSEKRRRQEMILVQENFSLQRSLADLEKVERELKSAEEELKVLSGKSGETSVLASLLKRLEEQKSKSAHLLEVFKKQEVSVETKEKSMQNAFRQWQEAQSRYQGGLSLWQQLAQEMKSLLNRENESANRLKRLSEEVQELEVLIQEMESARAKRLTESQKREQELAELEKTAHTYNDELEQEREVREGLEKSLAEKRSALGILEKKRHHLEIGLAEDAAQKKSVEHELLERHNLAADALASCTLALDEAIEEAEQQVRQLRVSLDRVGAVNMTAIEEYQSQAERFQELDRQLVDLQESKSDLEKIIDTLDGESRKIFKEIFEQIRTNFQKNFAILFNGGEANLAFTESPDVLQAGIEIVAKPPGKQMRSISLLSGGEKCLTALALLFSIFEVRPAPFCILDEVDAPLDDTNIERFTAVLRQYIHKTQFIVVTHNKKTMSIADLLLGVSMEEKGISKMLSLSFEKAALVL